MKNKTIIILTKGFISANLTSHTYLPMYPAHKYDDMGATPSERTVIIIHYRVWPVAGAIREPPFHSLPKL